MTTKTKESASADTVKVLSTVTVPTVASDGSRGPRIHFKKGDVYSLENVNKQVTNDKLQELVKGGFVEIVKG